MKKYVYVIAMFALCVIGMSSANAATVVKVNGFDTYCVDLLAGQTIDAGDVCFAADYDSNTLTIQFNPDVTQGWTLEETQLWIGTSLADMPQTKNGNPKVGNFPYKNADGIYEFDLTDLGFACDGPYTLLVAAHAAMARVVDGEVVQTETGWSAGDRFVQKGNWGTYTAITLTCEEDGSDDPTGDDEYSSETAFAFGEGATCFLDLGLDGDENDDFNRWGWTIAITEGNYYTFDLYAGAAKCDTGKGTFVGTLSVVYENGIVTATYNITVGELTEAQFYAGATQVPYKNGNPTVAPGFYTKQNKSPVNNTCVLEVTGLSGPIYIIAHATVLVPVTP